MANTIFSKNLRKLRENKKIPQKSAASSLGISQALLSHYEKGIRECGLDFLARAAKFYGVTTDFLLGIETENNINNTGDNISEVFAMTEYFDETAILSCIPKTSEIFAKDSELKKGGVEINTYAILYKNLLINVLSYIFDEMKNIKYKDVAIISGKYLSLSIYRLYTLLYNNHENNGGALSEKIFINELKYITALKKIKIINNADDANKSDDGKTDANNIFDKYNFENACLNNIINNNL